MREHFRTNPDPEFERLRTHRHGYGIRPAQTAETTEVDMRTYYESCNSNVPQYVMEAA